MIMMYAKVALEFLGKVPREVWYGIAAIIAFFVITSHYEQRGYDKRSAEYAEIARQAAVKANKADTAATATVTNETASVADSNAKAREAAEGSDDPLADGLGALRE